VLSTEQHVVISTAALGRFCDRTMSFGISVVMPTYNRARMLQIVLPSYLCSPQVAEVVVVNDGSSDDTEEVLSQIAATDKRVKVVNLVRNYGRVAARRRGAELVAAELVLFTEDDLELGDGYLETLVAHMEKTGADIISGRRIWMRLGETREQALRRAASQSSASVVDRRFLEHNSHALTEEDVEVPLLSATMLVRREVLDRVNYCEDYRGNAWREETDFQLSALQARFKLVFCPHAVSYHYARPMQSLDRSRILGNLRLLYWIFINNRLLLQRHGELLCDLGYPCMIAGSPSLTSLVYTLRRAVWLARSEALKVYLVRKTGLVAIT
jgi:GT2 family glycosyltransferase